MLLRINSITNKYQFHHQKAMTNSAPGGLSLALLGPDGNHGRSGEFEQRRLGWKARQGGCSVTATIEAQSDTPSVLPLARRLSETRRLSLQLAEPLSAEDQLAQSMPDASPTKWHLAHTTWFFETFVLVPHLAGYRAFDPRFALSASIPTTRPLGPRQPRPERGLLTRPSLDDVLAYRAHVDAAHERAAGAAPRAAPAAAD